MALSMHGGTSSSSTGPAMPIWLRFILTQVRAYINTYYFNMPNPHVAYLKSSIFQKPNPLSFNIVLPAPKSAPPIVPPGVHNPRTFLEIGAYLYSLLVIEVNHGADDFLSAWKSRPKTFSQCYQAQFTAYAQGSYPFQTPLSLDQSPLHWWKQYEKTDNAGILAVCLFLHGSGIVI